MLSDLWFTSQLANSRPSSGRAEVDHSLQTVVAWRSWICLGEKLLRYTGIVLNAFLFSPLFGEDSHFDFKKNDSDDFGKKIPVTRLSSILVVKHPRKQSRFQSKTMDIWDA